MKTNIKIIFFTQALILILARSVSAKDLVWENISTGIIDVRKILIGKNNAGLIYIGTKKAIFKSKNHGRDWRLSLLVKGKNKEVNSIFENDQGGIYVVSGSGLFVTEDYGESWKRVFKGKNEKEGYCSAVYVVEDKLIYLGTKSGLFISRDKAKTWYKAAGKLKNLPIVDIEYDKENKLIYIATSDGLYKNIINKSEFFEKIFFTSNYLEDDTELNKSEDIKDLFSSYPIKHIKIDPKNPKNIYLATIFGIYKSENYGDDWDLLPSTGLPTKKIQLLSISDLNNIYAVIDNKLFIFKSGVWKELSARLPVRNIYHIILKYNKFYLATDRGVYRSLFRETNLKKNLNKLNNSQNEPTIQKLHQVAIKYNKILDPRQIEAHRKSARLQALFPDLTVDYDKTISTYNNSSGTRFTIGPCDWSVSLKWDLGDLIWSEQQRLIDGQVRLLVQLRNDILDEINKLYFERIRLKMEINSGTLNLQEKNKKQLKIEELEASLDVLTGGYFLRSVRDN